MEPKDYLQAASTLIAAASVMFAVLTYRRSRLVQQITALRASLGDAARVITKLDMLLSGSACNRVGISIAKQIRDIYGDDITPEQLGTFISAPESHNLLIQALDEGLANTSIASTKEEASDKFANLNISLKTLAPSTSYIIDGCTEVMLSVVSSAFSTRHIRQVFQEGRNIELTVDSLKKYQKISVAYADLADTISMAPARFIHDGNAQNVFDQAREIFVAISSRLMSLTDDELRHYFSTDKSLKIRYQRADTIPQTIDILSKDIDTAEPLFDKAGHDAAVKAAARLQVLTREKP